MTKNFRFWILDFGLRRVLGFMSIPFIFVFFLTAIAYPNANRHY